MPDSVLSPGCCKPFFSSVMPGETGLLTDSALHEGFVSLCDGEPGKAAPFCATKYGVCRRVMSLAWVAMSWANRTAFLTQESGL